MNSQVRFTHEAAAASVSGRDRPPAAAPAIDFPDMYARTRSGENGQVEFATATGDWTTDIAGAHMRHAKGHVDYCLPDDMDRDASGISRVSIAVYKGEHHATMLGERHDHVVIAQQVDSLGYEVGGAAGIVMRGSPYRPHQVGDRGWAAIVVPAANMRQAFEKLCRETMPPSYEVNVKNEDGTSSKETRPKAMRYEIATRCITIAPV